MARKHMGVSVTATPQPGRITYVGHATALIELDGTRLLTDPVLRPRILHIRRHAAEPAPQVSEAIDAVLLSHLHYDHLDIRSLRSLGPGLRIIVAPGGARTLRRRGFGRLEELAPGESAQVGGLEVVATPAEHDGRRLKAGPAVQAVGYDVRGTRRVYFAGDTDLYPGMAGLGGGIDVALLPIGGWGTRIGRGHLDPRRAAQAAAILRPRAVIPIHWGTLAQIGLGRRRARVLRDPPRRFVAQLAELAPDVEAAVLEPGEALELGGRPRE